MAVTPRTGTGSAWTSEALTVVGACAVAAGEAVRTVVASGPGDAVLSGVGIGLVAIGAAIRVVTAKGDRTRLLAEGGGVLGAIALVGAAGRAFGAEWSADTLAQVRFGLVLLAVAVGVAGRIVDGARDRAGGMLAGLGVAFLVLGGCVAWVAGGLDGMPTWLLASAGVSLVASGLVERDNVSGAVTSRTFVYGSGASVLVLLAGLLSIGVYALAERNDKTWDVTRSKKFTLSDHARQVAKALAFDVEITGFFRASAPERAAFAELVDRFREATPRVTVHWVDPLAEPLRASQANVTGEQGTVVLSGNGNERRLEGDVTEEELVRELVMLGSAQDHKICWSLGHGEPDPDDEFSPEGLGGVRSELEGLNYTVVPVRVAQQGVPRDCEALVVARPTTDWFPYEREALAAYIAEGGHAMVLLDPGEVEDLAADLERYGVSVGDDVVLDMNLKNQLLGVDDPSLVVLSAADFGQHEITRNLAAAIVLPVARSVRANPEAEGVEVTDLLRTSPDAWAETTPEGPDLAPDPGVEIVGEVPVMAVVEVEDPAELGVAAHAPGGLDPTLETEPGRGVPADFAPKKGGRLVVVGDGDFASNRFLVWGNNRDLFLNSLAWLVDEEDQIGERPAAGDTLEVSLTGHALLCVTSVVIVPGVAMAIALITLLRRRYL